MEHTLREICAQLGVSHRTVQGYEKWGLLAPTGKNKYGYLLYDQLAVEKIKTIRFYQLAGGICPQGDQRAVGRAESCEKVGVPGPDGSAGGEASGTGTPDPTSQSVSQNLVNFAQGHVPHFFRR